jgi:hypothetical protein
MSVDFTQKRRDTMETRVASIQEAEYYPLGFVEEGENVFELGPDNITNFLAERFPQQYILSAVINAGTQVVCSPYTITTQDCDGHLIVDGEETLFMPMARLCQVMGQVGSLMVLFDDLDNGSSDNVALAMSVSEVDSLAPTIGNDDSIYKGLKKMFLVPGDKLIIMAEPIKDAGKIVVKAAMVTVYFEGEVMIKMRVNYEVMPSRLFTGIYKRQQRQFAKRRSQLENDC